MLDKFTKTISFTPAWDHRATKSGGGIGATRIHFVLKGKQGAVTFNVCTGWYLPQNREGEKNPYMSQIWSARPYTFGLGVHSSRPTPWMEGDGSEYLMHDCPYVKGGNCYYAPSSFSLEEEAFEVLIAKGTDGLWELLENEYNLHFERRQWWSFLKRKK